MEFFSPGKYFPAISVTGERCELNCPHCRGKYLKGMRSVETPDELYDAACELMYEGKQGFLLSGGCDGDGRVPLTDFMEIIGDIKKETDLKINVHTGWIREETANDLAGTGVDVVSYDIIGSSETISRIYGLEIDVRYILRGYQALLLRGIKTVPHVTVGLHHGKIKGEFHAVDRVSKTDKLIINSLIPSRSFGRSVSDGDILSVLEHARGVIKGKIILGCMRERGRTELEIAALKIGVDGIVNPGRKTVEWAEEHHDVKWYTGCCSLYR